MLEAEKGFEPLQKRLSPKVALNFKAYFVEILPFL